jgi:hypothetical protein
MCFIRVFTGICQETFFNHQPPHASRQHFFEKNRGPKLKKLAWAPEFLWEAQPENITYLENYQFPKYIC